MQHPSRTGLGLALLITFFGGIFLTSCSTLSLTYRYADWLLYWKIDQYIDITSEQQPFLEDHLATLRQWHKKEELPRYIRVFNEVKAKWSDGLTQHELERIFHQFRSLWNSLGQQLVKQGTPILSALHPDQIRNLEQTIQKENKQLLDQIETNRLERIEKRREKIFARLEDWLGPLTQDQKLRIDNLIQKVPDTTQAWFDNRVRRQDSFINLLKSRITPPRLEQNILDLLVTPEKGASQAYLSAIQQREAALFSTIIAIDRMITLQQREHARQRLEAVIQELQDLVQK